MYGVLYAISPELFPTKDRGTGNALVAVANRVFGIMVRARHLHPPCVPSDVAALAHCPSLLHRLIAVVDSERELTFAMYRPQSLRFTRT